MYKSLQGGRAVAATLVVLYHLGPAISAAKYFGCCEMLAIAFSFGDAGVEFFFVLSGFIILSAHKGDISKPEMLPIYVKKRFARIYPTYWIVFISTFVLAIAWGATRNSVPHDLVILLKALFLIPQDSRLVGSMGAPVIGVAWTLQYEMFFYCFFGILILNRWLALLVVLTITHLYVTYSGVQQLSFPLRFFVQDYILLFVIGMAVAFICTQRKFIAKRPVSYVLVGAALFSLVALDTVLNSNVLRSSKTILYGGASGLLVFGLVQAEDKGLVLMKHPWMQLLGDSSYALYLIHYPLISVICKLSIFIHLNELRVVGALIAYFSAFFLCVICAVAFHIYIERPVAAYVRNRRTHLD